MISYEKCAVCSKRPFVKCEPCILESDTERNPNAEGVSANPLLSDVADFVYEFIYTDCKFESSMYTVSIHKTMRGAYRAMNKYINSLYMEWYNHRIMYGKKYSKMNFGWDMAWKIKRMNIED